MYTSSRPMPSFADHRGPAGRFGFGGFAVRTRLIGALGSPSTKCSSCTRASASKSAGMSLNSATEAVLVLAPWASAGSGQYRGRFVGRQFTGYSSQLTVIGTQNPAHRTLPRNRFRLTVDCISHSPPHAATVTDAVGDDRLSSRPLLAWSVHGRAAHFSRHRARRCSRGVTKTAERGMHSPLQQQLIEESCPEDRAPPQRNRRWTAVDAPGRSWVQNKPEMTGNG